MTRVRKQYELSAMIFYKVNEKSLFRGQTQNLVFEAIQL
jgi:hypothetical protein